MVKEVRERHTGLWKNILRGVNINEKWGQPRHLWGRDLWAKPREWVGAGW